MKLILDTNIYVEASRSEEARARFRATFVPLLPVTFLAAVVAYELRVNAADSATVGLIEDLVDRLQRSGRVVTPSFSDWTEASEVVASIAGRDPGWKTKLPALLDDILIALSARQIGATVVTYNVRDFQLIRRHKEFSLRAVAPGGR